MGRESLLLPLSWAQPSVYSPATARPGMVLGYFVAAAAATGVFGSHPWARGGPWSLQKLPPGAAQLAWCFIAAAALRFPSSCFPAWLLGCFVAAMISRFIGSCQPVRPLKCFTTAVPSQAPQPHGFQAPIHWDQNERAFSACCPFQIFLQSWGGPQVCWKICLTSVWPWSTDFGWLLQSKIEIEQDNAIQGFYPL